MTLTAIELWNDKKFIEKRIREQREYLDQLEDRRFDLPLMSTERFLELHYSAWDVEIKFINRLKELNENNKNTI